MNVKIFPLQHVADERGQLSIIEEGLHCPFDVKRVFWIFDVPQGRHRGAHAHRVCHEFIVAIEGSFDVTLFDGREHSTVHLDCPTQGLHIPPGTWATELNFAPGSICLVLASMAYDESEYIREIEDFMAFKAQEEGK